jgi:hypothetical protein|tara:strand:- start:118 stop:405 length:288 start_codon:yes stop_codon:yes gene_type:complete
MKDKPKKRKEPDLQIIGLIDEPRWKKLIPCICNDQHDLRNCKHCKYQNCENSLPHKPYEITIGVGTKNKRRVLVTKITIVRGSDEDIIAWKGESS